MLQTALDYMTGRWLRTSSNACSPVKPMSGLLGQLTDLQRKLAFEHRGSINSWDEDVPLNKRTRAAA